MREGKGRGGVGKGRERGGWRGRRKGEGREGEGRSLPYQSKKSFPRSC